MPAIIHFLGYDPTPEPTTLPERMRDYRRKNGLTIKEAAHRMGVDESSWGQWERTGLIPWKRAIGRLSTSSWSSRRQLMQAPIALFSE
jgi:transcriptional regulator with XRE-family HTH domain